MPSETTARAMLRHQLLLACVLLRAHGQPMLSPLWQAVPVARPNLAGQAALLAGQGQLHGHADPIMLAQTSTMASRVQAYYQYVFAHSHQALARVEQHTSQWAVPVQPAGSFLQMQGGSASSFASIIMCIIIVVLAIVDAIMALIVGVITSIIIFAEAPPALLQLYEEYGVLTERVPSLGSIFEEMRHSEWPSSLADDEDADEAYSQMMLQTDESESESMFVGDELSAGHRFLISVSGGCQGTISDLASGSRTGGILFLAYKWKDYAKQMRTEAFKDSKKLDPPPVVPTSFAEVSTQTWENMFSSNSTRAKDAIAQASNQSAFAARYIDMLPRRADGTLIDCHNGAPVNGRCECFPGFEGEDCSKEVDCGPDCKSKWNICMFGICLCMPGHFGPECKAVFEYCRSNCSGHGVCHGGLCRCDPGFVGEDCSETTAMVEQLTPVSSPSPAVPAATPEPVLLELEQEPSISIEQEQTTEEAIAATAERVRDLNARIKVLGGTDGNCQRPKNNDGDFDAAWAATSDGTADSPGGTPSETSTGSSASTATAVETAPAAPVSHEITGEGFVPEGQDEARGDRFEPNVLLQMREQTGVEATTLSQVEASTRFMCGPTKAVLKWVKKLECKYVSQIQKHIDATPHAEGPGAAFLQMAEQHFEDASVPLTAGYRRAMQWLAPFEEEDTLAAFEARLQKSGVHDEGPTRELLTKLLDSIPAPATQQPLHQSDVSGAEPSMLQEQETAGEGAAELARTAEAEVSSALNSALAGARTQGLGGAIGDTANTFVQLILAMVNVVLLILAP